VNRETLEKRRASAICSSAEASLAESPAGAPAELPRQGAAPASLPVCCAAGGCDPDAAADEDCPPDRRVCLVEPTIRSLAAVIHLWSYVYRVIGRHPTQRQFLVVCIQAECRPCWVPSNCHFQSAPRRGGVPARSRRFGRVGRVGQLTPRADPERCPVSRHREKRAARTGKAGSIKVYIRAKIGPAQQTPFSPSMATRLNSI
jgi:hypothetical protein